MLNGDVNEYDWKKDNYEHIYKTKSGRPITYNGREYTRNISPINNDFAGINSINDLFENLLEVWCRETAYPNCQKDYNQEEDLTFGQCAITAALVHDIFGGTIHKIFLDGGGTHYFNKINGIYVDLTSDQFDFYNIPVQYEPNEEVPREYCGKNSNTLYRFELLKRLLKQKTG